MIFGTLTLEGNRLHTHNDTYVLSQITTISARRPFLGVGISIAALLSVFGVAFFDLLYAGEVVALLVVIAALVGGGLWLGQLRLLSRDLRGSPLGDAVWGGYHHLNRLRHQIAAALHAKDEGGQI